MLCLNIVRIVDKRWIGVPMTQNKMLELAEKIKTQARAINKYTSKSDMTYTITTTMLLIAQMIEQVDWDDVLTEEINERIRLHKEV